MTTKKDSRGRKRDYKKEYARDHSSAAAKKARARRNRDRARAVAAGKVKKGDSLEVHHPKGNARGKPRVVTRKANRSTLEKGKRKRG